MDPTAYKSILCQEVDKEESSSPGHVTEWLISIRNVIRHSLFTWNPSLWHQDSSITNNWRDNYHEKIQYLPFSPLFNRVNPWTEIMVGTYVQDGFLYHSSELTALDKKTWVVPSHDDKTRTCFDTVVIIIEHFKSRKLQEKKKVSKLDLKMDICLRLSDIHKLHRFQLNLHSHHSVFHMRLLVEYKIWEHDNIAWIMCRIWVHSTIQTKVQEGVGFISTNVHLRRRMKET